MQVSDIMTRGIESVRGDDTVSQTAKKMRSLGIGALAVQSENMIIGMISKKDIVYRCVAEGSDPLSTEVSSIMTTDIATCWEDDTLENAALTMESRQLHRLVVMSNENEPVGIISLCDIAVKGSSEHLAWEVLERISEPACPNR